MGRLLIRLLPAAIALAGLAALHTLAAGFGPGARFDELHAGGTTYAQVRVLQVTPRALIIKHAGGLTQVPLASLPPDVQEAFGYDSARSEAYAERLRAEAAGREARAAADARQSPPRTPGHAARWRQHFGTPATLQTEVDLRPRFHELDLHVKRQGLRPSCSVFAVVSALEYQAASGGREATRFSEDYLIWATRKSLGLPTGAAATEAGAEAAGTARADLGFSLLEVVQALRTYGAARYEQMPNTYGTGMDAIAEPGPATIEDARENSRVAADLIPGRDRKTRVHNIIHALNARVPVVAGLAWPHYETLMSAPILHGQTPREGAGHAVTLVGYRRKEPAGETLFIFRNSWGNQWGVGGYGYVSRAYLEEHLQSAVVLDVP